MKSPLDPEDSPSIRGEYERLGADAFYRRHGSAYRNPHEPVIADVLKYAVGAWRPDLSCVLDLAAGSGEVSLAVQALGATRVDGIDPYTHEAYESRVGRSAERFTFEQIAAGALKGRRYSLIVCSFALHLFEESRLPRLAIELTRIAPALWILTPHKRPKLDPSWGWTLDAEEVIERVRIRAHRSTMCLLPAGPASSV